VLASVNRMIDYGLFQVERFFSPCHSASPKAVETEKQEKDERELEK